MRIAICDDEEIMRIDLKQKLDQYARTYKKLVLCNEFGSGEELLSSKILFDIIFLDYQMNGISGMETAEKLRCNRNNATIIFLSNYSEVVFQSFKVNTFRFLVKPLEMNELFAALNDFNDNLNNEKRFLVKQNGTTYWVPFHEIIYLEAQNQYTIIRTMNNAYKLNETLSKAEPMLPSENFVRCHRSYIVNFEHIENHTKADIQLDNGERALISRNFYQNFKNQYIAYIKSKTAKGR